MRMSIFRPVTPPQNEFTDLVQKYSKYVGSKEKLIYEVVVDFQKLSDKQTDNNSKMVRRFDIYHVFFKKNYFIPAMRFANKHMRLCYAIFKSWFIKPIIGFVGRKLCKNLIEKREDIPDELYNHNAQILWDTFEETYDEWLTTFKNGNMKTPEEMKKNLEFDRKGTVVHCYFVPKFFIKFMLMVYLEDTSYREMINMFMFRLQGNMNKAYNPEIKHQYPLYSVMYDNYLPYFIEWLKKKPGGGTFNVKVDYTPDCPPHPYLDPKVQEQVNKEQEALYEKNKAKGGGVCAIQLAGSQADSTVAPSGESAASGTVSRISSNQDCQATQAK